MSVVDDLKAARAEVEKGWCQGLFTDDEGGHCALGALNAVIGGTAMVDRHWSRESINRRLDAERAIRVHLPEGCDGSISHYNDAATTTKQDVLNLFDKALADLGGLA